MSDKNKNLRPSKEIQNLRRRKFVDAKVQTGLLFRIGIYWFAGILFVLLPLTFLRTIFTPSTNFFTHFYDLLTVHWPVLVIAALMLPITLMDVVKYSHRFVGPVYRLRMELSRFRETGRMRRFNFRTDDFWQDLAPGINRLTDRIEKLEAELKKAKQQRSLQETIEA